jgi:predicted ATPase
MLDAGAERVIPLGGGRFVRSKRGLVREDSFVPLSPTEVKLLLYLVDHAGEEVTFRQLLTEVWGYREGVESRTVYSTVNRLRNKIERDAASPEHLLAVPGIGYRFVLAEPELSPSGGSPDPGALVGRQEELRQLLAALETERVVALVGTGGVGKTRLAAEVAQRAGRSLPGGAVRVDLGAVSETDSAVAAVAAALGLTGARDPLTDAGLALAQRGRCILWLDEVEALAGRLAPVASWVALAPEATFLLTSRLPPELEGEHTLLVPPLPQGEAVALLLQRSRAVRRPGEELQEDEDIRALCAALDGLPLALELAAARLGLLSPADLHERLLRDLSVLRRRARTGDRHDSLEATLSWSWELLEPSARRALAAASVFSGSFDLEAAEQILSDPGDDTAPDVLESLDELVECGLLRSVPGPVSRFVLLETVRTFAAQRLEESGARLEAELRHGAHYAACGADPARSDRKAEGIDRLMADRSNLEAAAERAVLRGDAQIAARAGYALVRLWQQGMPDQATLALTERILATGPTGEPWCRMAYHRAVLLWSLGRLPEAAVQLEQLIEGAATPSIEASARSQRGTLLTLLARNDEALREHERAVAVLRQAGEAGPLSRALFHLGGAQGNVGRLDEAERTYEEALKYARISGFPGHEASVRGALVLLTTNTDRPMEAYAHATAAVELADRCGDAQEMLGARLHAVNAARCLGRTEEALARGEDALGRARQLGIRAMEGWARHYIAQTLLSAGRADDAVLAGLAAAEAFRDAGQVVFDGYATVVTALALWRLGRLPEAQRTAEAALERLEGRHDELRGMALALRALVRLRRGQDEGLDEDLERARALTKGAPMWAFEATVTGLRGLVAAGRGRLDEARGSLAEAEQLVARRGWEPPGGLDVVLRALRQQLA